MENISLNHVLIVLGMNIKHVCKLTVPQFHDLIAPEIFRVFRTVYHIFIKQKITLNISFHEKTYLQSIKKFTLNKSLQLQLFLGLHDKAFTNPTFFVFKIRIPLD